MSNLIHCDGPDCNKTKDVAAAPPLCTPSWLMLEQADGLPTLDFCSRGCLAAWSKPRDAIDDDQCMCDGSQVDPHTVAQHRPRPMGVNGL